VTVHFLTIIIIHGVEQRARPSIGEHNVCILQSNVLNASYAIKIWILAA